MPKLLLTQCLPLLCDVCVCISLSLSLSLYTHAHVVLVFILSKRPLYGYQIGCVTLEDWFTLWISFIPNLLSNAVYYVLWNLNQRDCGRTAKMLNLFQAKSITIGMMLFNPSTWNKKPSKWKRAIFKRAILGGKKCLLFLLDWHYIVFLF